MLPNKNCIKLKSELTLENKQISACDTDKSFQQNHLKANSDCTSRHLSKCFLVRLVMHLIIKTATTRIMHQLFAVVQYILEINLAARRIICLRVQRRV